MVPTVIPGDLMENRELNSALIGQELHDGWVIEKPRPRIQGATGSYHCAAFIARNAKGQREFVTKQTGVRSQYLLILEETVL